MVGAGNAGCFSALHFAHYTRQFSDWEIELIHDPSIPTEEVGQATLLDPPHLLWGALGTHWHKNELNATPKLYILYEGFGKKNYYVLSTFPLDSAGLHYSPKEMQKVVLSSGLFDVTEDRVEDLDDIDSDYIFDCRGTPKNFDGYKKLKNPINSVLLSITQERDLTQNYTRSVATPDGWTFVIPNTTDTTSYGYLYNSDITTLEDATTNFRELFDVGEVTQRSFSNYISTTPVIDDRIFLNGNRLFFLEPMEATAVQVYLHWTRLIYDVVYLQNNSFSGVSDILFTYIEQVQNYVLWHYQFGSKYDTPFWDYAKTFTFDDPIFDEHLGSVRDKSWQDCVPLEYGGTVQVGGVGGLYGMWSAFTFKQWYEGMTNLNIQ